MVDKVSHSDFAKLVRLYYDARTPIGVQGTFGIGKSATIKQVAQGLAKDLNLKFIEWNNLSHQEKEIVSADPEPYFCFTDIRLAGYDSSDIKGLPDYTEKKLHTLWRSPFWASVVTNPKSKGVLFFDEINLAYASTISSIYQILQDRQISEQRISDGWSVICAGNKDDDRAYTHELASPVKDRMGEVELTPPKFEEWLDWATKRGIDTKIIAFLNMKPSNLRKVDFNDGQKYTTERGWERLHKLMQVTKGEEELRLICTTAIGEGIGMEFLAFCKIQNKVDIPSIIKKPSLLRNIEDISIKYFISTALAEHYKDNKMKFEDILAISKEFDEMNNSEFVILLWKLAVMYAPTKFSKDFTTKDLNNPIRLKYHKYLR